MNPTRISDAVYALETYTGEYTPGDGAELHPADDRVVSGGLPGILVYDPDCRDWATGHIYPHRERMETVIYHDVAGWLGLDAETAQSLIDTPTLDELSARLWAMCSCPECEAVLGGCGCHDYTQHKSEEAA